MYCPDISVIVCTYNQENTISRTLNSIISQKTLYKLEIIIGEDDSSDTTRVICEEYSHRYPSIITLLPSSPNKGLLKNKRDCLFAAKGKYLASCAGDDWWHDENKIQKQVFFLENNPNYVLTYSGCKVYNEMTGSVDIIKPQYPKDNLFDQLLNGSFIFAGTVCFRREVLKHIDFDLFISKGFLMEDYPMWLTMCQLGKFHCFEEPLTSYTVHIGSLSYCKSIEEQEKFEYSALQCKLFFLKENKNNSRYNEIDLIDQYYRRLINIGVRFNDKNYSISCYKKIVKKGVKDHLKYIFCLIPLCFSYLRKINSNVIVK